MASIRFFATKKVVSECVELTIRFTANRGVDFRSLSKIFVPVSMWNEKTQSVSIPRRFHSPLTKKGVDASRQMEELSEHLQNAFLNLHGIAPTSQWLKSSIAEFWNGSEDTKEERRTPVHSFCIPYINRNNYSRTTNNQFKQLANELIQFGKANKKDIYIEDVSVRDLERFEQYLLTTGKCQNTANGFMRKFRAVVRWCYANDTTEVNPFGKYKIKECVYGTPNYLTIDERDALYNTPMRERYAVQRDIFVFQCHVGCRVSDLVKLTTDNLDGDFLQYIPTKTKTLRSNVVRVPLSETAKEIIERHKRKCVRNKLLPFISEQKYNDAIKEVLKLAKIDRKVLVRNQHTFGNEAKPLYEIASSHLARRTFMKNVFTATKSERITSSLTGHADGSRAFSRYVDIDDDLKINVIAEVNK